MHRIAAVRWLVQSNSNKNLCMQQAKRVYDANTSLFTVLQDWAVASIQLPIYSQAFDPPRRIKICLQLLRQLCAMHAGCPIAKIEPGWLAIKQPVEYKLIPSH